MQRSVAAVSMLSLMPIMGFGGEGTLPPTTMPYAGAQKIGKEIEGLIQGELIGKSQSTLADQLISKYRSLAERAPDLGDAVRFNLDLGLVEVSQDTISLLKTATIARAVAAREWEPLRDVPIDFAADSIGP